MLDLFFKPFMVVVFGDQDDPGTGSPGSGGKDEEDDTYYPPIGSCHCGCPVKGTSSCGACACGSHGG